MDTGQLNGLIYLDNAATSFPKPSSVVDSVRDCLLYDSGNAGRGSHILAMRAAERVYECRERLAAFFEADGAEQVCFTLNTTEALNIAIKGLLRRGDHVLISDMEHNAVYRPIYKLWSEGRIEYDVFSSLANEEKRTPSAICAEIAKRMRRNTRMLVCTGASNICSLTMPLEEIGDLCRKNGIIFVVDGAQCAGHIPISMKKMKIDALCIPSHKGLLGAQGCGALILGKGITPNGICEGGNGIASLSGVMEGEIPERLEAGTLPLPAIAGLCEGIRIVEELGIDAIEYHEKKLFSIAAERIGNMRGTKIFCPHHKGSVLTFSLDGYGSEQVADILSRDGICVRAGFHCCALGHKTLGSDGSGGVRVSFGVHNSSKDVDRLVESLAAIGCL